MFGLMSLSAAAKGGAEMITSRQVENLAKMVRNGAPLDVKRLSDAEKRVLQALMAQQAATSAAPQ